MLKNNNLIKKIGIIFLIIVFSNNVFGAVVSDNDGSAFITKAEFDSLKNNFQSQIDQYNTSIDSKIDGAIASYLAGISVDTIKTYKMNIDEIKYPLQIIHHKKNIEEADDSTTTIRPQIQPLWAPSWIIMTSNIRNARRFYTKFVVDSIDNVGEFVAGTRDGNNFIATGTAKDFVKTDTFFFQLDGWWNDVTPWNAETSAVMFGSYIILSDNNGIGYGPGGNNAWLDRGSYMLSDYSDNWSYNQFESNLNMTSMSADITKENWRSSLSFDGDWSKFKTSTTHLWLGPNHTSSYHDGGNSYTVGKAGYENKFTKIYNDNAGDSLAPVSYKDGTSWKIYYTNKRKNRLWYWWNNAKEWSAWAFKQRAQNSEMERGTCALLTRGYNLESELENTSRNWYNKCLIKQNRINYNFTANEKTFRNHKMVNGTPIFYFDKKDSDEYKEVTINFNMSTSYASNKKYIVFSTNPITLSSYSTDVDSDNNFIVIKKHNNTVYSTVKRKIELVNGSNTIEFAGEFEADTVLYYKVLWDITNAKNGTNYDDEYITISEPTIKAKIEK